MPLHVSDAVIDMSNQINNTWSKSSILALCIEGLSCSLEITKEHKSRLQEHLTDCVHLVQKKYGRKGTRQEKLLVMRLMVSAHGYMIQKVMATNKSALSGRTVHICRDSGCNVNQLQSAIRRAVQKVGGDSTDLLTFVSLKFGLDQKQNAAHKHALAVFQGDQKSTLVLNSRDIENIIELHKATIFEPSATIRE